ncbi:ciliogenesis-associated TTC17-interacting protein-like [Hyla sarda]|uniref:ciliogenesis-associated TTC17-interacting protein-like n=1 Tax=Hyla sarda TaxID=327740 RepID=UPI0024C2DDEB|nr:ciliogenesis-associated TTC17-interacting protein-like [Hyla sarda]
MSRVKISDPAEQLRAGTEAVEFLSSVGLDELRLCLFSESLPSFSEFGAELGAFTASVQLGYYEQDGQDQKCFLVHISSQSSAHDGPSRGSAHDGPRRGSAHEVPCGCSVTAFISQELETLEQHQHEYLQPIGQDGVAASLAIRPVNLSLSASGPTINGGCPRQQVAQNRIQEK